MEAGGQTTAVDPALEIVNKRFVPSSATGHLQLKSKRFINAHIVRPVFPRFGRSE